jgi:hypothetical protein
MVKSKFSKKILPFFFFFLQVVSTQML